MNALLCNTCHHTSVVEKCPELWECVMEYCQSCGFIQGEINGVTSVGAASVHHSEVYMKERSACNTLWTSHTTGDVFAWPTFSTGTSFDVAVRLAKWACLANIISLLNCVNMELQSFSLTVLTCLERKFSSAFLNKIKERLTFAGLLSAHEPTPGAAVQDVITLKPVSVRELPNVLCMQIERDPEVRSLHTSPRSVCFDLFSCFNGQQSSLANKLATSFTTIQRQIGN